LSQHAALVNMMKGCYTDGSLGELATFNKALKQFFWR